MSASTRASDWRVAGVAGNTSGVLFAGGVAAFMFQSDEARFSDIFVLPAGGLGVCAGAGGASLPNIGLPGQNEGPNARYDLEYTPIQVEEPFSAEDLHGALGVIGGAGVTGIGGYDWVWITARALAWHQHMRHLFQHQECHGYVAGVHAGLSALMGVWISLTLGANSIGDSFNPNISI